MGQVLGNLKNISEANPGDLSGGELAQRGAMAGLKGGLQGLLNRQPQQGGGNAVPIGIAPPPAIDVTPKRNPFYGGY